MWIFKIDLDDTSYTVGYLQIMSLGTSKHYFVEIYKSLTLGEAERKVNYLNGGRKEFAV